jgi:hypothetical protein
VVGLGHKQKAVQLPLPACLVFGRVECRGVEPCEGQTRDVSEPGAFVFDSACPCWDPGRTQLALPVFEYQTIGRYCDFVIQDIPLLVDNARCERGERADKRTSTDVKQYGYCCSSEI